MAEWFKDWFDTKYYHILYKNRDDSEAEQFVSNLISQLDLAPKSKVLDLACGKGRHSIYLNQRGFDVVGIDLSQNSIDQANQQANEHLRFYQQDMREAMPEQSFDAVFNLFTSFGYFDSFSENAKVLESVKGCLKSTGILVIDFMNVEFVQEHFQKSFEKEVQGIKFQIHKKVEDGIIVKDIQFEDEGREYQYTERVQVLKLDDFDQLLSDSGFEIKSLYGDYNLATFDPANSERLIIMAKLK